MNEPQQMAPKRRSRLATLAAIGVPLLVVGAFALSGGHSLHLATGGQAQAATVGLQASERHRKGARLVGEVIERQHYRQTALDEKMSSEVFDQFFDGLDSSRAYFLASDIAEFEPYRQKLGEVIRTGKLEPVFEDLGVVKE